MYPTNKTKPTMRKTTVIFTILVAVILQSCEGPIGPIGPEGPQGLEGKPAVNSISEVFQVTADFTEANKYEQVFDFKPNIFESEVVLAFIQWETSGQNPVWRALPQTIFFNEGVLVYNYDFTKVDFRLFLDGPIDYKTLGTQWTRGQKFRIVVVPGDFTGARMDWTNYEAVIKLLGIDENDFASSEIKSRD